MKIQYRDNEKAKSEQIYSYWYNKHMPRPDTDEDYEAVQNGDKDAFKQVCSLRLIDLLHGRIK